MANFDFLKNLPVKDILNSKSWINFIQCDESMSYIGMKIMEITFIQYILSCSSKKLSTHELTLLEHQYLNNHNLEEFYDVMKLYDIVPEEQSSDKVKQVRAFYGMLYFFENFETQENTEQSNSFKLCCILTQNLFGKIEISLPALQDPKTYINQLLCRLRLPELNCGIISYKNEDFAIVTIQKTTLSFFRKHNKILPKNIKTLNCKNSSNCVFQKIKQIFDSQSITIAWVDKYLFTTYVNMLTCDEKFKIQMYMQTQDISYFSFKNVKFGCELFSVNKIGKKISERFFNINLIRSNDDFDESKTFKLQCFQLFISEL